MRSHLNTVFYQKANHNKKNVRLHIFKSVGVFSVDYWEDISAKWLVITKRISDDSERFPVF